MPTTDFDYGTQQPVIRVNPFGGTSFAAPQVSGLAALLCAVSDTVHASTVRNVIRNTGQDLSALDPQYAAALGGGLADYSRAIEALGGGWDGAANARGLLPVGNTLAFFTDSTLDRVDIAIGATVTSWAHGELPTPNVPMLSMDVPGLPTLLVWKEGDVLEARTINGDTPPGWPVTVGASKAPVIAAGSSSQTRMIIVPRNSGSLVLEVSGSGVSNIAGLGRYLAVAAVELSRPSIGMPLLVASARPDGRLEIFDQDYSYQIPVGPGLLPPVIMDPKVIVAAASDSLTPATKQHVLFIQGQVVDNDVPILAPPLRFLSLAGFASLHSVVAVVADSAGGIYLTGGGNARHVDAGGPLAGEVLCADIDGDFQSDLIALRTDGILLAWNSNLEPLAGFPRTFPLGAAESPVIGDSNGERFIAVTDTTGHVWSLPVGPAIGPKPWPAASGGGGRSRYLGFAEGTPVQPSITTLNWSWSGENNGTLCWSGRDLSDLVALRARVSTSMTPIASARSRDQGCMTLASRHAGDCILLEGQDRTGTWRGLGALTLEPPAGLRVGIPRPNPFRAETHIDVNGASGPVEVHVIDLSGRIVWSSHSLTSEVIWSGQDDQGRRVPSGLYFLRVSNQKQSVVRRVLRLD